MYWFWNWHFPSHPQAPPLPVYSLLPTLCVFQDLKKFHVNTLVRVCDATYDKAPVEKEGIQVVVSRTHWAPVKHTYLT